MDEKIEKKVLIREGNEISMDFRLLCERILFNLHFAFLFLSSSQLEAHCTWLDSHFSEAEWRINLHIFRYRSIFYSLPGSSHSNRQILSIFSRSHSSICFFYSNNWHFSLIKTASSILFFQQPNGRCRACRRRDGRGEDEWDALNSPDSFPFNFCDVFFSEVEKKKLSENGKSIALLSQCRVAH